MFVRHRNQQGKRSPSPIGQGTTTSTAGIAAGKGRHGRRPATGKGRGIAVTSTTELHRGTPRGDARRPDTVAAGFPWPTATGSAALNPSAGSDTQRRERPGPSGNPVPPEGQSRAARRRSAHPTTSTHLRPLSRAAVTGASNRAGSTPSEGPAAASGLTADPAHNRLTSAGRASIPGRGRSTARFPVIFSAVDRKQRRCA